MKILLISNVFPPGFVGGYELAALDCAAAFFAHGHEIRVLTSDYFQDDSGELERLKVERSLQCSYVSHHLNTLETKVLAREGYYVNTFNLRKIGSAIRRFEPDVVMLWNLMGLGTLGIIEFLQAAGVPVMLYLMDNVFGMVDRSSCLYDRYVAVFGEPHFTSSTKVVAMSRNIIGEISHNLGFIPEDIQYIPAWMPQSAVAPEPERREKDAHVRFVVCSRIAPHKGVDLVAEAAEQLVRQGDTAFSIEVYGAGQVAMFMQQVHARGLADHVSYGGCKAKAEIIPLFRRYDALLFPTWPREAFGFNVVEAAGGGCFPIMTGGIGASEWFIDNVDSMKIRRTPQDLAAAMQRTMWMTSEERYQMRIGALETARRYLTFERWFKVIENACVKLASSKPANIANRSRSAQSALLYLTQLWLEALP